MKNIKIITTADKGGLIDQVVDLNRELNKRGYKSFIIKIDKFNQRSIDNIKTGDNVIFQMSHYGYQNKGMPLWIINELIKIKKKSASLGIFFHELFISANLWSPRFIIKIIQKYINIKILKNCDYWITSNSHYADWLKKYSSSSKNYVCPVHSNINHKMLGVNKNKKFAVIFGTAGSRIIIYKKYFNELKLWVSENNVILFDVGPRMNNFNLKKVCKNHFNINILGKLSSKKVSNLFSKTSYGIFITPDEIIDKSGVMAAYSLYKICPINLFNFKNKNSKIKCKRYLKYFPNTQDKKSEIKNLIKLNYKLAKKNNLNQYVETYEKNFN